MENAKKNLVFHFGVGRPASFFQIGYVKEKHTKPLWLTQQFWTSSFVTFSSGFLFDQFISSNHTRFLTFYAPELGNELAVFLGFSFWRQWSWTCKKRKLLIIAHNSDRQESVSRLHFEFFLLGPIIIRSIDLFRPACYFCQKVPDNEMNLFLKKPNPL